MHICNLYNWMRLELCKHPQHHRHSQDSRHIRGFSCDPLWGFWFVFMVRLHHIRSTLLANFEVHNIRPFIDHLLLTIGTMLWSRFLELTRLVKLKLYTH